MKCTASGSSRLLGGLSAWHGDRKMHQSHSCPQWTHILKTITEATGNGVAWIQVSDPGKEPCPGPCSPVDLCSSLFHVWKPRGAGRGLLLLMGQPQVSKAMSTFPYFKRPTLPASRTPNMVSGRVWEEKRAQEGEGRSISSVETLNLERTRPTGTSSVEP